MSMSASLLWWIAAGLVVGAELLTGTFYLLLLAVGMLAAGTAAWLGAPPFTQMLVCAAVGGLAMLMLLRWRARNAGHSGSVSAERDLDLDVGQSVHVRHWGADGTATVHYRGAPWQASWAGPLPPPGPGDFAIVAVNGSRLVLGPI